MNCPGCGAAMEFDAVRGSLTCKFCGAVRVLQPDADGVALLGRASPLECPACKTPLEEAAVHSLRLLCCPRCRGLLVSMDVFVEVTWALRAERTQPPEPPHRFDPKDLDRAFLCPRCGAPMDTHPYAGPGNVAITTCEFCHLEWLDHGALRHIVSAPDGAWADDSPYA
jgi:Zn-finger nucleic acid-binding protein